MFGIPLYKIPDYDINIIRSYEPDVQDMIFKQMIHPEISLRHSFKDFIKYHISHQFNHCPNILDRCLMKIEIIDILTGKHKSPKLYSVDISDKNWYKRLAKRLRSVELVSDGVCIEGMNRLQLSKLKRIISFSKLESDWKHHQEYEVGHHHKIKKWSKQLYSALKDRVVSDLCDMNPKKMKKFMKVNDFSKYILEELENRKNYEGIIHERHLENSMKKKNFLCINIFLELKILNHMHHLSSIL